MRRWNGTKFVGHLEPGEERPLMDLPRLKSYDPSKVKITFNGVELESSDAGEKLLRQHPVEMIFEDLL